MPGFPMTIGTTTSCFHQAPARIGPTQTSVFIQGQLVATADSTILVAGCLFNVSGVPQPCLSIRWNMVSSKVLAKGKPLILMPPPGTGIGPGMCLNGQQAPQGFPTIKANQHKVFVT
jgi:hypothetical protein